MGSVCLSDYVCFTYWRVNHEGVIFVFFMLALAMQFFFRMVALPLVMKSFQQNHVSLAAKE